MKQGELTKYSIKVLLKKNREQSYRLLVMNLNLVSFF